MKVSAFLIADKVYRSAQTKKLNIEGIFGLIYSEKFPAIHRQLFTVLYFEGRNKKYDYELYLEYKGRKVLISKVSFEKKDKSHAIISDIKNLPVVAPGEYTFEAKLDGRVVAKRSVSVEYE